MQGVRAEQLPGTQDAQPFAAHPRARGAGGDAHLDRTLRYAHRRAAVPPTEAILDAYSRPRAPRALRADMGVEKKAIVAGMDEAAIEAQLKALVRSLPPQPARASAGRRSL